MKWIMVPPATIKQLGFIPSFIDENDPRRAVEQFHDNYQHGGGWMPIDGFKLTEKYLLKYPGDPPLRPLAITNLRDEIIIVYESAFVAVIQLDRSVEVSRLD